MRIHVPLLGFAALFSVALPLQAAPHAHGVGKLNVSLSGDTLTVALESPLDNILGFERAPKYEKDFAKVREVAAILREGDKLFATTAAAACQLVSVKLASDVIEPKLLGESAAPEHEHKHEHKHAEAHKHEHADLDAEYSFRCAEPGKLKEVEVMLFQRFSRLRQLDTQLATDKVQRGAKLTRKANKLAW